MDWDVHHGNGTQDAFYDDPSVLFISTHQFPYYPGSGAVNEIGAGAGEGYTLNIPLPAGCADAEYLASVSRYRRSRRRAKFEPDWILVSAGFDPHRRDPLGGMDVTEEGFGAMAQVLLEVGGSICRCANRILTRRRIRSGRRCAIPWRRCWTPCKRQVPPPAGQFATWLRAGSNR